MSCVNILMLIMLVPVILIIASPVTLEENANPVNIQLINEIHNPSRSKRSASEPGSSTFPDHLVFGVPVASSSDAILRLKRTTLLPTFTSSGKVDTVMENSAVYTDLSRHSAMLVRRAANEYSLQGTFEHSGQEWNLQPLSRSMRSSESHQLTPLHAKPGHEIISFVGDEYTVDGKPMENLPPPKNTTRHKRDATQHVVEIAFVVDYEDFSKWVAYVGASNAINEMQLWYTYVAESINVRYQTIQDADIAMSTRTSVLRILTDDADATFIEDIVTSGVFDGRTGLNVFRSWVGDRAGADIPTSDHYMLFTGFDINGATGIAFGSAVCSVSSVSISENTFQATLGGIAAHELGHSLSAAHDDNEGCSDADQFIMSAILSTPVDTSNAGNPWKFSSCSINRFKEYLNTQSCTLPASTSGTDVLPAPSAGQRAGEVLSLDNQCRRLFQDSASFFCTSLQIQEGGLNTVCGGMYCAVPGRNGLCQTSLPQEFSSCGTDQWCILGECVSSLTPSTTQPPTTTTEQITTTTTPEPTTTTTTTTTTPEPTTTTTTTTTTPEPTTTTTTTTTTPEPTTTTPEPTTTTTTTTTTPEPTTTTPEPTTTTTTTTPEPTTTTTTTTPEPTTTTTTTTTTPEPTTTTTTTTTTTPEPTTTTPETTTTTTTAKPTTTAAPQQETTSTTQQPSTADPATTIPPTVIVESSQTTSPPAPTTTPYSGPTSITDCLPYIFRDWDKWWQCVREVYIRQRRIELEQRRKEQERRRKEQEKRRKEQQERKEKNKNNTNNKNNKNKNRRYIY